MAVAGVTTADDNAVSASLESAENEHRVNAARAGYADDLNVRGIVQTVVTSKVSTCIGTPVATECNDQGFIFFHLHIASTSAIICALAKPFRSIAPEGQATVQAPQPWQTAGLTEATLLTLVVLSGIRNSLSSYVIAP